MENLENQTALSQVSHRPLEIAKSAISTFPPPRRRSPSLKNEDKNQDTRGRTSFLDRKTMASKNTCRNRLRQGINHVFWVSFLWPVLK